MKKIILFSFIIFFLFTLFLAKTYLSFPSAFLSPIISSQIQNTPLKIWQPKTTPSFYQDKYLDIHSVAALAIETKSGQVLFAKNANQPLPIASLSKIMTAIIAYEETPTNSLWAVSQQAAATKEEETRMNLKAGEKFTREELLYGLMVVSANDAAHVIAENVAGRRSVFVQLMNQKASSLNLIHTRFYNPSGLDEELFPPNQSTAYELAIMTQYLRNNFPEIKKIMGTKEIILPQNEFHQEYHLVNILGFEKTYPGIIGGKTGNTDSAGFCLIDIAQKGDKEVMIILLNSSSPKDDARQLFDFSFRQLLSTALKHQSLLHPPFFF